MSLSNRSAFEAIPGKDALLEYQPKSYPPKTYVERNGLVYKSLSGTSSTFIDLEWELIADLREVRVPNIASRNALTGSTPTSGTTGIRIPILDNTNVLVLNASADPQVGANHFARYNYNKTNGTWLLLQNGTGTTSTNVSDYNLLTNKPNVISGITVNTGVGLIGGGTVLGGIPANGGSVTVSHADTSSQASITPTGYTYTQQLKFDTFGHVTGATTSTWVHPDTSSQANVLNTGRTYIQSISVDSVGHITNISSSPWTHPDTSSQASSVNAGNVFIQSINLDGDGHVIGLTTGTAAGGGGSGYNFKVNGNSGGALTIVSGATLNISGGTNIQTVRSGNSTNPGIRINVVPAGNTGQVQYNSGGSGLAASSNFVYSAATNVLRVGGMILSSIPTSGFTNSQFLMRDISTGEVQRTTFATLQTNMAALPINAVQFRNAAGFGGDVQWQFDPSSKALTLGSRGVGAIGLNSVAIGTGNIAPSTRNFVVGMNNDLTGSLRANAIFGESNNIGNGAFMNLVVGAVHNIITNNGNPSANIIGGLQNSITGSSNIIGGNVQGAYASYSLMTGYGNNTALGADYSVAVGNGNRAKGIASFVGGYTQDSGRRSVASGRSSFTYQSTDGNLPLFSNGEGGARAHYSAVLGGINNNIDVSNTGATIIGGNLIALPPGGAYAYTTNVQNLAIWIPPAAGGSDDVLTWNAASRKITKVPQSTFSGGGGGSPAGANTQIQYNNAGAFGASAELSFISGQLRTPNNIIIGSGSTSGNRSLIADSSSVGNTFRIFNKVGNVLISGGTSNTASSGYNVTLQGGANLSTGSAGSVFINGGAGINANSAGSVSINGGANSSSGPNGGITLNGGTGNGAGGSIGIAAGSSLTSSPGSVTINAGNSSGSNASPAGSVSIQGGTALSLSSKGGSVNIFGGGNNGSNIAGDVNINGGASSGGATNTVGNVNISAGVNSSNIIAGQVKILGGFSNINGIVISGASQFSSGGGINIQGGTLQSNGSTGGQLRISGGLTGTVILRSGNLSGNAGNLNISGGTSGTAKGGTVNVLGGTGVNNGGDVNITGGTGGNSTGGAVNIIGGRTTNTSNLAAGNVNITGGLNAGTGNGIGGNVNITGGIGLATGGGNINLNGSVATTVSAGGNILIAGGASNLSGLLASGKVTIQGGQTFGSTAGNGGVSVDGGSSSAGNGGDILLRGGSSASATSRAGNISIQGGFGTTNGTSGGNVSIIGGTKGGGIGGSGNNGNIFIDGGNITSDNTNGNIYLQSNGTFVLGATNGRRVLHISAATANPTAAPSQGVLLYFDGSTNQLKAWKAGAGAAVVIV